MMRLLHVHFLTGLALVVSTFAFAADDVRLEAMADRMDCLYAGGETGVVAITARDAKGELLKSGKVTVRVDNFGARVITNVTADLSVENPFSIRVSRKEPGFVRFSSGKFFYGIGFDVRNIAPGTPLPDDFVKFWKDAIAKYDREIPAVPEVWIDEALSDRDWIVERVAFAAPGGRKVYGFVSKERKASGRLPARVSIAAAGYGSWSQGVDRNKGRITMKLTVFPFEPDVKLGKKAEYDALDAAARERWGVKRYCQGGISESREAYFFYPVILANNRAIDWLASREDVDPEKIDYAGTSQGGGLGLAAMALNGHFARGAIFVPALTDLLGFRAEDRQSGWPQLIETQTEEHKAAAERNAPYFCGVNFARQIKAPIRFVVGYADQTCSPNAVYSAFNACPSSDKDIFGGVGMSHSAFGDYYSYLDAWSRAAEVPRSGCRFLSFNVWGDYFKNPVSERDEGQVEVIRRWDPDFIGFQEMTSGFWKSRLVSGLENTYAFVGRGLGVKGDSLTPLAYRRAKYDLLESGVIHACAELDASKGAVWAVLKDKAGEQKLVVFSSHAWWRYDGRGDDWIRLHGAKLLAAKMKELAEKYDAPVVGGGDLNAPLDSSSLKYLVDSGFADAQQSAVVSPRGFPTEHGNPIRYLGAYVGRNAANGHNVVSPRFRNLDHIFYSPDRFTAVRFDLDISPLASRISDHHPIVADFVRVLGGTGPLDKVEF